MEMLDCACLLAEMSEVRGESAEKAERPAMSAQGGMIGWIGKNRQDEREHESPSSS